MANDLFPNVGVPPFKDADALLKDKSVNIILQLAKRYANAQKSKNNRSYSGLKFFFAQGLVNYEIKADMLMLMREYCLNRYDVIAKYDSDFRNNSLCMVDPAEALFIQFINLLWNVANSGDKYTVDYLITLYKIYHKKEYNQIKKFSRINMKDMSFLVDLDDLAESNRSIARILGMAQLMGITIDNDCNWIYCVLDDSMAATLQDIDDYYNVDLGVEEEAVYSMVDYIDDLQYEYEEDTRAHKFTPFYEACRFVEKMLIANETTPSLIPSISYTHNAEPVEPDKALLRAGLYLSALGIDYEAMSYEEICLYAVVVELVESSAGVAKFLCGLGSSLLGFSDRAINAAFRKRSSFPKADTFKEPVSVSPVSDKPVSPPSTASDDELSQDIAELRKKIERLEADAAECRAENKALKKKLQDVEQENIALNAEHKELVALREHVYSMTEISEVESSVEYEEMKAFLQKKKIVVIGGNENWVVKLRCEFPDWKYISGDANGVNKSREIDSADMVYLFTDTIGHGAYWKYMNYIKEHNVPFKYIHGVNIKKNVEQIYIDFEQKESHS